MQRLADAVRVYPTLATPRFTLRRPTYRDIAAIVAIAGDRDVASSLARVPHPYDEAAARAFIDVVVPAELAWAIVERDTGVMVGIAGLAPGDDDPETVSLGYYVARERWGAGIATEVAAAVMAYAIGLVGGERITARYFADNPASGRILEKLGFRRVSEGPKRCLALGCEKTSVLMGLDAR